MTLFRIAVALDCTAEAMDRLGDEFARLACPYEVGPDHPERCPRRWFVISTRLDDKEGRESWQDVLAAED
jgi:hypothetical protein